MTIARRLDRTDFMLRLHTIQALLSESQKPVPPLSPLIPAFLIKRRGDASTGPSGYNVTECPREVGLNDDA